jgi:hypothetical protein
MTLNWLQIARDISKNSSHRLLCLANLLLTSQSCSPGRCALRVAAHPPKPSHVELLLTHKKHAQEGERDSPLILLIPRIREGNLAAEFELICCVAWFGSCPRSCESLVGATWFRGRDAARVPATWTERAPRLSPEAVMPVLVPVRGLACHGKRGAERALARQIRRATTRSHTEAGRAWIRRHRCLCECMFLGVYYCITYYAFTIHARHSYICTSKMHFIVGVSLKLFLLLWTHRNILPRRANKNLVNNLSRQNNCTEW